MRQKCNLTLSDGNKFEGYLVGAPLKSSGELVFTTGMVGYSEAITDPSYFGQILCFTYPLIGNYGIPSIPEGNNLEKGFESSKPHVSGVIITIDSPEAFHWNSFQTIDSWLKHFNIPGIVNLDTRHLVHLIRSTPNLLGKIEPEKPEGLKDFGVLTDQAGEGFFDPSDHTILPEVSTKERVTFGKGSKRIGFVDCGVKWNIIRQFVELDCEVEVVPWDTDLSTVDCDGWLITNGPGDPTKTGDLRDRVAKLLDQPRPIMGICLGHQIVSLAAGAKTERMKYGHRSHNQPVYQVGTRPGYITSQNHGYVVKNDSIPEDWEPWFKNANDQTNEGIKHKSKPFYTVQFHPEASGGPRDTAWIFEKILAEVKK